MSDVDVHRQYSDCGKIRSVDMDAVVRDSLDKDSPIRRRPALIFIRSRNLDLSTVIENVAMIC